MGNDDHVTLRLALPLSADNSLSEAERRLVVELLMDELESSALEPGRRYQLAALVAKLSR
jgi:hypothetical protein